MSWKPEGTKPDSDSDLDFPELLFRLRAGFFSPSVLLTFTETGRETAMSQNVLTNYKFTFKKPHSTIDRVLASHTAAMCSIPDIPKKNFDKKLSMMPKLVDSAAA